MNDPANAGLTEFERLRRQRAQQPVQPTMMRMPLRVTDILRHAEQVFPEQKVTSRHGPGRLVRQTYADIALDARRLGAALVARGVRPGMRVATLMWNHGAHLTAYYAIPAIDAVLHTLNPRLSPEELAYIVADAGDAAVLVDDDLLPLWQEVARHVSLEHVIVHPLGDVPNEAARAAGHPLWHELLAQAQPLVGWPEHPIDENAPVSICYTSGTTGRPKGVVYSHRSVMLHAVTIATPDALGISGRDTVLTVTPMFHVNAWSMPYASVMMGAHLVLPGPRSSPEEIADLMADEQASASLGVPTIWNGVLDVIEQHPGRWQFAPGARVYSGGSAPPPEMYRRFDRIGLHLQTGWGMTETSPLGSQSWVKSSTWAQGEAATFAARTSNGLPLAFVQMRHVDEECRVLPWDGLAVGELQVRGPWITQSYIGHPDPLPATSADGWFKTGDIVKFQPEGYMWLVDRQKDLVKSGGEWISSVDMENALCDHPAVAEAAVIAVPDTRWGERPLAIVALRPGRPTSADSIIKHLLRTYPKWMVPQHIEFVDALPKTGVGKLDKKLLRQRYA